MGMFRQMGLSVIGFLVLCISIISVKAEVPRAADLLRSIQRSNESVSFVGKRVLISAVPEGSPTQEELIIRKAPDKKRVEILSPEDRRGFVVVFIGRGSDVKVKVSDVERPKPRDQREPERRPRRFGPFPPNVDDFPPDNLQLLISNYRLSVLTGGNIAGRRTYLLEVEPKSPGKPSRKVWVDSEKNIIMKMEHYDPQKKLRWVFAYSEINFNPTIDEQVFDVENRPRRPDRPGRDWERKELWNYRQGDIQVNEIREKIGFNVNVPMKLPEGFYLQNVQFVKFQGQKNVHLIYSDGLCILSVFQSPQRNDRRPQHPPGPPPDRENISKMMINGINFDIIFNDPIYVMKWTHDGIESTIMAELSRSEIIKSAKAFTKT